MPSGLMIKNVNGEFTVSSEAKFLHFLGKPTLVSTTQASGNTGTHDGWDAGHSMYRLNLGYDTVFFLALDLPLGSITACVTEVSRISAGVFDIKVYAQNGLVQVPITMWAFGFAPTGSTNYGLQIFKSNGELAADFARPYHLFPRGRVNGNSVNTNQTIPALGRPAILGMPSYYVADITPNGGGSGWLYTYSQVIGCWTRLDATTLRMSTQVRKTSQVNEFPTDDDFNVNTPTNSFLIDAAGLP